MSSIAVIRTGLARAVFSLVASKLGFDDILIERCNFPIHRVLLAEFIMTRTVTKKLY